MSAFGCFPLLQYTYEHIDMFFNINNYKCSNSAKHLRLYLTNFI